MNAKEKAKELIEKYKDYVHGYVGSSMLTNHEYPEQILAQAKKCSLIAVDEIDKAIDFDWMEVQNLESEHRYWANVRIEIEKL